MNGSQQAEPGGGPAPHTGYVAQSEHIRNIAVDIVITVLSLYLFNLWVQHKQMLAANAMLRRDKYSFWTWALLSLVTCGIYHVYHEFRKSEDVARATGRTQSNDGLVAIILTIFGLGLVNDAIQQSRINEYFGSSSL